jgi:DNA-binding CsgD family transcriptional regulator
MSSASREPRATIEVRDALGSSLCLHDVVRAARAPLLRLLGGDHLALGFVQGEAAVPGASPAQDAGRLEWITSDGLPPAFFADYERWAADDFVLKAVVRRPRTVLADADMVSRSVLEANPFHRRARELGVPLQHVMGVMLDVDALSSGLAVYRQGKRAFGGRERALLQALVPAFAHAVRNCQLFEGAERRARILERVVTNRDGAVMVFDTRARELFRTQRATRLLERWFGGAPSAGARLPDALSSAVKQWLTRADGTTPSTFSRPGSASVLSVAPEWVADVGQVLLSLVLEERPRPPWSPEAWARVTPRQRAVVAAVVQGWDNELIASELGCSVPTVKRHLTQIYDTLGVGSRAQLMAAALASGRGSGRV